MSLVLSLKPASSVAKVLTCTIAVSALMFGASLSTAAHANAQQNSLHLGVQLEPPLLDPTQNAAAAIDEIVYLNIFEGLTRFNADGSISPLLAKSWSMNQDGTSYTFELQQGVSFHDGAAFDANDVKYSLERARADDSLNAQKQLFAGIDRIEVLSPYSLRITLKEMDLDLPSKLAWGDAVILDPQSAHAAATAPIGTGPFVFDFWLRGQKIGIKRNENYWGDKPALESAEFTFISDPNAAYAAMLSEQIDAFSNYPSPETLSQFAALEKFKLLVGTTEGETILAMNNAHPALSKPEVRRAITHALDRAAIINVAMLGYATPIGSHFAPHHPDYIDLSNLYPYDPKKARDMLAQAGATDLTLELVLPPADYAQKSSQLIIDQLGKVGIKVNITNVGWAQWLDQVFKQKNYDMTIVSHTEPMDINIYSRPDYYFNYNSPQFNALMERYYSATDPAERREAIQEAQRKIAEDAVNVFLFQRAKTSVAQKGVQGLWLNAPTQANDLTGVSWQ